MIYDIKGVPVKIFGHKWKIFRKETNFEKSNAPKISILAFMDQKIWPPSDTLLKIVI